MLLVPAAQALHVMLDTLYNTIRIMSLKINVQYLSHIVFRDKIGKIVSDVEIFNQILRTATECR